MFCYLVVLVVCGFRQVEIFKNWMGKSRSSNLVNIMVGDMTCVCWCTTQSSLLRENPWGNGRRYGVVIVRCVVEFVTSTAIYYLSYFGRSSREFWRFRCSIQGMWMWTLIVIFIIVIKVCRKVPSMVSLFLNTCFSDVFIDRLEGGGKNDEKVGIAILRQGLWVSSLYVAHCLFVAASHGQLCESDKGSVFGGIASSECELSNLQTLNGLLRN